MLAWWLREIGMLPRLQLPELVLLCFPHQERLTPLPPPRLQLREAHVLLSAEPWGRWVRPEAAPTELTYDIGGWVGWGGVAAQRSQCRLPGSNSRRAGVHMSGAKAS